MDSAAVKLWRDKFKLNLSASWKHDVDVTVQDLKLWAQILDGWFYFDVEGKRHTRHPGIKGLLTEYERLDFKQREKERERQMEAAKTQRSNVPHGRNQGVPKWLSRAVPKLLD